MISEQLQGVALKVVDAIYSVLPQRLPTPQALQAGRLVSHRGEHDNRLVYENTLQAFHRAAEAGVWGLEADIRWSGDLVPLVTHDADGRRLFGDSGRFADMSLEEIRSRMPMVPTLQELLADFGGRMHLMLEIKDEHYPQPGEQKRILRQLLSSYQAGSDFHFLALDDALFERVDFVDRSCCLPVAELNFRAMSKASLEAGYGGLTGHFLFLNRALQRRHEAVGQKIGTGFISSRNCLYRELNRGVEWIFSNRAVLLQFALDQALERPRRGK